MAAALLLWLPAVAGASGWRTDGWLTAAGGQESDLTLDSSPTPAIVPGGPFLSLIGGFGARTGPPRRTRLELVSQGWYERFTEADARTLFSATLAGDAHLALDRHWALRLGGGGHYFDDTARTTSRRVAGWGETGLVWTPGPWRLEVQGGLEGRRYPRLELPDAAGTPGVYTEAQANVGVHAAVLLGHRVRLRGAWHTRWTDARDPFYDAEGPTAEAGAEASLGGGVRLLLDALLQERTFTARTAGEDRDRYRQVGAGLDLALGARWQVRATAVLSRYTWPDGREVDTHRFQLAATLRCGSAARGGLPGPGRLPRDDDPAVPRAGRPVIFRVLVPRAASVALVGDFNGWDAAAEPLRPAGGGWWETARLLPAGTHAYAYVVDGAWLTPPEAAATEPDGFGGRNGLLVVLP